MLAAIDAHVMDMGNAVCGSSTRSTTQVRSSHPTNLVCNENIILTILMATCAQFLHCHENTDWLEAHQTTGAGRSYSLTKHGCNDKNNVHCSDGGMHSVS